MNAPVQKLSAPHSPFVKRVLPFLAIAAVSVGSYWSNRQKPHALEMSVATCVIGLIVMWLIIRRGFWRVADTVEDHGDRLVVTRWKTRAEIAIANMREIQRRPGLNGSYVTILLNKPSALGAEIKFLAPGRNTTRDIEERLDSLARRIASRS
ncbi:MAG TPA: hypothetical protein VH814_05570 [Steroidobacteraceae bacterium]|jgi:hypothetical protein